MLFSTIRPDVSVTDLNSPCNADCDCSTALYNPVCADGIQYFSPCYAGCTEDPVLSDKRVYVCNVRANMKELSHCSNDNS